MYDEETLLTYYEPGCTMELLREEERILEQYVDVLRRKMIAQGMDPDKDCR